MKKICDQKLHMLKSISYLAEDKKKAAKYLIEEMMSHEDEIKSITLNCEDTHDQINRIII
jgi:hypothetical protein